MIAPHLSTARLTLRPLQQDDLAWVCEVAGDYGVSKWLVPVAHPYTMADAQEFLALDRAGDLGTLWVIETASGRAGVISIGKELGYWLAPSHWGQGIMTEAAVAAVAAHFEGCNDAEIRSSHFVGNEGSRRVLEKLGFIDVGGHIHFSKARQAEVPGRSMRLSRADWQAVSTKS